MFDPATYTPGDPWTSADFMTVAPAAPNYEFVADADGEAMPGSFFECRGGGRDRFVEASAHRSAGSGAFTAALERSTDGGLTWQAIESFVNVNTEQTLRYNTFVMLRWRLVSVEAGTAVTFRLVQHL